MALKTIAIPWRVDNRGKLVVLEGDDAILQVIIAEISDNFSENPFQSLDRFNTDIFKQNIKLIREEIAYKVKQIFKDLESRNLAALNESAGISTYIAGEDKNEIHVSLVYRSLETDQEKEITISL